MEYLILLAQIIGTAIAVGIVGYISVVVVCYLIILWALLRR